MPASTTLDTALDALLLKHNSSSKQIAHAIRDAAKTDGRFKNLNPVAVAEEIAGYMESVTGVIDIKAALDGINKTVRLDPKALIKPESWLTKVSNDLHALPKENKINAGMWGAGALMGAFGFASAAKNSVQQDAEGKNQIQWSSVGVALLQGALAAGCAYMGAQALRSGVGR